MAGTPFLVNKREHQSATGVTSAFVEVPGGAIVGDLMVVTVIGPPGQPDDPWIPGPVGSPDTSWEPISVPNVTPSTSPMVLHCGQWYRELDQTDLDAGSFEFAGPDQPGGATRYFLSAMAFRNHLPSTPIEGAVGWPISEDGGNPANGTNGNPSNPNCDTPGEGCPDFYTDDTTASEAGALGVFLALSHQQAHPIQPPEGWDIVYQWRVEGSAGADITLLIVTKLMLEAGVVEGPHAEPSTPGWENAAARMFLIRPSLELPAAGEAPRWFIGDPNEGPEPSTAVVEFENLTYTGLGIGIIDAPGPGIDLGDANLDVHTIEEQGYDWSVYGGRTRGKKRAAIRGFVRGQSFSDAREVTRLVHQYIDQPWVLVCIPPGEGPTYFDCFPGSVQSLLGGQVGAQKDAFTLHQGEVLVQFERQASSRGPRQNSIVTAQLSNAYNEHHVFVPNEGSAESPVIARFTPNGEEMRMVRVRVARRSHGNLTLYAKNSLGGVAWDAERADAEQFNGATVAAATPASSGQVVRYDMGDPPFSFLRVDRFTAIPEDPTGLVGVFLPMLIARQDINQIVRYSYHWGNAFGQDPLPQANPYVEIDSTGMLTSKFRVIPLGEAAFETNGNALAQELWLRGDDDTSTDKLVDLDQVVMMPADEQYVEMAEISFLSLSGSEVFDARSGQQVTEGVKPSGAGGSTLVLPALAANGMERVLGTGAIVGGGSDKTDEAVSAFPPAGTTLTEGLHRLVFVGEAYQADSSANTLAKLVLRRSTDGGSTFTTFADANIRSLPGVQRTQYDPNRTPRASISWRVTDDTDVWVAYVVFTADREPTTGTVTRSVTYREVRHGVVESVSNPDSMVLDGWNQEAFVSDAAGAKLRQLAADASLSVPAGGAYFVVIIETEPDVGMDAGAVDGPAGVAESDERITATFSVVPMHLPD